MTNDGVIFESINDRCIHAQKLSVGSDSQIVVVSYLPPTDITQKILDYDGDRNRVYGHETRGGGTKVHSHGQGTWNCPDFRSLLLKGDMIGNIPRDRTVVSFDEGGREQKFEIEIGNEIHLYDHIRKDGSWLLGPLVRAEDNSRFIRYSFGDNGLREPFQDEVQFLNSLIR